MGRIQVNLKTILRILVYLLLLPASAFGGSLDSTGVPAGGSGMPALSGICNQLDTGVQAPLLGGPTFGDPSMGPGSTMCTLLQLRDKGPVIDAAGATDDKVLAGAPYWGLASGQWGNRTGSMPNVGQQNVTPGTTGKTITKGYHDGTGIVAGDANLVAGNIKSGVTVFGVAGQYQYLGCFCGGTMNGTRWCDNGNGTVTDMLGSGGAGKCLVWLKNANCSAILGNYPAINKSGTLTWSDAEIWSTLLYSGVCSLADGSSVGDWRQPSRSELTAIVTGVEPVSTISMLAFANVQGAYWSSTADNTNTAYAWFIMMTNGASFTAAKTNGNLGVWPVRSEQ
jgi:hypothetical protein